MTDFTSIYFTIFVCLLSTVRSTYPPENEDSSKVHSTYPPDEVDSLKGPGISGCRWFGMLPFTCNESVPVESVPRDCTSLLYDGIEIDLDYQIVDTIDDIFGAELGLLDKLIATNIKTMVYYSHTDRDEWLRVLDVDSDHVKTIAQNDMNSLKSYVDQHNGIQGFIIQLLESHELNNLTENIKTYMDIMRSTFPDMEIGMVMHCDQLLFYQNFRSGDKWLDFDIIDSSFDFYILNYFDINNCTDEFVQTGVFPLTGNNSIDTTSTDPAASVNSINTIDSLRNYVEGLGVPMSKLYIEYQPYGTLRDPSGDICSVYYQNLCSANIKTDDNKLCADTQQSLYEKGQYAQENSQGFVISIDLDDSNCSCECGRPFPVFYALLDGFNGVSPAPGCPLFDRC